MKLKRINCHICQYDFRYEPNFYLHLKECHNIINIQEEYDKIFFDGKRPSCLCRDDCEKSTNWNGWRNGYITKYSKGHNARNDSVFLKKENNKLYAEKRKLGYKTGKYKVWNAGLTKENSEKVKIISAKGSNTLKEMYKSGSIIAWQHRDGYSQSLENLKQSIKKSYHEGRQTWNKGLSKESDESIKIVSDKLKSNYKNGKSIPHNRFDKEKINEIFSKQDIFKLISNVDEYKNRRQTLEVVCNKCMKTSFKNIRMILHFSICHYCNPKESSAQLEIYNIVKQIDCDAILSDRKQIHPKELDIYIPSKKIAIEYNGLYWHSENFKNKLYHQKKYESCENKQIKLLTIYEDEWKYKKEAVISNIKRYTGNIEYIIDVKKCKFSFANNFDIKCFFDINSCCIIDHLYDYKQYSISFNGEVIAIFLYTEHDEENITINYFAFKNCYYIDGWFDYVVKHINKKYKNIFIQTNDTSLTIITKKYNLIKINESVSYWYTDLKNRFAQKQNKSDMIKIYSKNNKKYLVELI